MLCAPLQAVVDLVIRATPQLELQKLSRISRSSAYFKDLAALVVANQKYPIEYCLWISRSVRDDFVLLKKLSHSSLCGQDDKVKSLALEALQKGFSASSLEKIVGDSCDVELLDEALEKRKFEEYTCLLGADCSICLSSFSMDDFVTQKIHRTACRHFFHEQCLASWIKIKPTCPQCREPLSFKQDITRWYCYLKKIDQAICDKFPEPLRCNEQAALALQDALS
jgi:hypothetical protein